MFSYGKRGTPAGDLSWGAAAPQGPPGLRVLAYTPLFPPAGENEGGPGGEAPWRSSLQSLLCVCMVQKSDYFLGGLQDEQITEHAGG